MRKKGPLLICALMTISILIFNMKYENREANFPVKSDINSTNKPLEVKGAPMSGVIVIDPYENYEVSALPHIIPLSASQSAYILEIMDAASSVLADTSTLDAQEPLFGKGDFIWPKDLNKPTEVTKIYNKLKFKGMQLIFQRTDKHAPWTIVSIAILPRNFPKGNYEINFKDLISKKLNFQEVITQKYPGQSIEKINSFRYLLNNNKKIQYTFFENSEMKNMGDTYPSRFYSLEMKRLQPENSSN